MTNNNNNYENIHKFLAGEMNKEEEKEFNAKMQKDQSLKNKLKMEKNILHTLELAGDKELMDTIYAVHNDLKKQQFFESQNEEKGAVIVDIKRRTARRMLYAIAAVMLMVVASWFFFSNNTSNIDANAVYANYYKSEKTITNDLLNNMGQIGAGGQLETREEKMAYALDQYNLGGFENAKKIFLELNAEYPKDQLIALYIGLCQMETGNFKLAINHLKTAATDGFEYTNVSQWYLALSYLKNNQKKEAINLFGKIAANNNSNYQSEAKKILENK